MSEPFFHEAESYLSIKKWQKMNPGLCAGFTTRKGGLSLQPFTSFNLGLHVADDEQHVLSNRNRLADQLQFPLDQWVAAEQVHADEIAHVTRKHRGRGAISYADSLAGMDGLMTNETGLLCTAFFADCVPLFFFDPVTGYIGIAHAGWKGSVRRIGERMVRGFQRAGTELQDLQVVIGPAISQKHYEVDDRVIRSIPKELRAKVVHTLAGEHYLLDLKQLNTEILLQCGVLRHNIDITKYCTFDDESLFFSHRRDDGKTGRMLGYIGYLPV